MQHVHVQCKHFLYPLRSQWWFLQEPLWTADQENTPRLAVTPPQQRKPVSSLFYPQADSTPTKAGAAVDLSNCQVVSSQRFATPSPEPAHQQPMPALSAPTRQQRPLQPIHEEAEENAAAPGGKPHASASDIHGQQQHRHKPKAAKQLFTHISTAAPDAAQLQAYRLGAASALHAGHADNFNIHYLSVSLFDILKFLY
jgi:hypothetical protein